MSELYASAGVDLNAGYESVERIKKHTASTNRLGAFTGIGAFGAMFDLSALGLSEPLLVSGTDGVGTKLLLAIELDKHDTIGVDAVAMCVNDVLAQGAEPLFFLDYIASGKIDPTQIEAIVSGIAEGCRQAGVALIGGETAEMPDMYAPGHYDLAGFTVGAVEKSKLITGSKVGAGDVLIGLPSSGVHSNGFSLVRKVVMKDNQVDLKAYDPDLGTTVGEALLEPTRIYVKPVLSLIKQVDVHGIAHITGGGFIENVPRMLPDGCQAIIDTSTFTRPPVFDYLRELGDLNEAEMYNIFNMGIGMVIAVSPDDVDLALQVLEAAGESPAVIGQIVQTESNEPVIIR